MAQTLLERELRQAMSKQSIKMLPMYPEGRACAPPTAHRVIELFEPVARHVLQIGDSESQTTVTERTPAQQQIVELLGLSPDCYGHWRMALSGSEIPPNTPKDLRKVREREDIRRPFGPSNRVRMPYGVCSEFNLGEIRDRRRVTT